MIKCFDTGFGVKGLLHYRGGFENYSFAVTTSTKFSNFTEESCGTLSYIGTDPMITSDA